MPFPDDLDVAAVFHDVEDSLLPLSALAACRAIDGEGQKGVEASLVGVVKHQVLSGVAVVPQAEEARGRNDHELEEGQLPTGTTCTIRPTTCLPLPPWRVSALGR